MRYLYLISLLWIICEVGATQSRYSPDPRWYKTYDVKFYNINLNVNDTNTYIQGNTLIKLKLNENSDSLVLNFNQGLTIDSVLLNKKKVKSHYFQNDLLIVKNSSALTMNSVYDIDIYYRGNVISNLFFSSVSSKNDGYWNIPVTWTLSEPFGAKLWFPCKQQLSDKADSCWMFLTVPRGRKAGSVGLLTDTIGVGMNKVQYRWKTRYPIAYYLISFSVANYSDYSFYTKFEGRSDSLLVQNYIYNKPGCLDKYKDDINNTSDFLRVFSDKFGLYPFYKEKYGHCLAPISGGMEHQTMTTLNSFNYSLVSHELTHQWFGDYVTCATWQDIWINEGFASYGEYVAYEFLNAKERANSWILEAQNMSLREPEGSVFVPASESEDEFRIFSSNLSYKKGAVIIHMLRKIINNDELFFKSLRTFLDKYKYSSATGEEFKKHMEQETGITLTGFFDQWYYGRGFPIFDISWKQSNDTLFLKLEQTSSSTVTTFFNTPLDIKATGLNFDTAFRINQTENNQLFKIKLSKSINSIEFDPQNWLLKKVKNISQLPEIPSSDNYLNILSNPFGDSLKLAFKEETFKDDKVQIIGIKGSVISETYVRKKKEAVINTSVMSPGVYLLILNHGQDKYVRKIIKAN
jgi:aminopeptidase N